VKNLSLSLLWLTLSCSPSTRFDQPLGPLSPGLSSAPATTAWSLAADGEPYALRLEGSFLTFCDERGRHQVDLTTGHEAALDQTCPTKQPPNTACVSLGLDVAVRASFSAPNDFVDVGAVSFPLEGRVHDCAANGKRLAIVTASVVVVLDTAQNTVKEISRPGGERVAIGSGWVAWTQGPKVRAARWVSLR
jgi:hypothetical protein